MGIERSCLMLYNYTVNMDVSYMKKVLIINGSPRAGQTRRIVACFTDKLGTDIECEIINLREKDISYCKGCALCLSRGEEFCPGKDDFASILAKMDEADAIVFATPIYSLDIPGLFKNFFDRLAFVYHRPRFFNKIFTSIITQGVYGGSRIDKYFKTTAGFWGGFYLPGEVFTLTSGAYDPSQEWNDREKMTVDRRLTDLAARLEDELGKDKIYSPSLFRIFMFRLTRTSHKLNGDQNKDRDHFQEMGWFSSDYFYPVGLNTLQKLVGVLADIIAKKMPR